MPRSKHWDLGGSGVHCIPQVNTFSSTRLAFLAQESVEPTLCCDKADTNAAQQTDTSSAIEVSFAMTWITFGKSADKPVRLGQGSLAEAGKHSWHRAAEDSTFQFFALSRRKLSITRQMCSQRLLSNQTVEAGLAPTVPASQRADLGGVLDLKSSRSD